MTVGVMLKSMRVILKPYADVDVRVPLSLIGSALLLAGAIRLLLARRRNIGVRYTTYMLGVALGVSGGMGIVLVSEPVVRVLPPNYGFVGLGFLTLALVLGFRAQQSLDREP